MSTLSYKDGASGYQYGILDAELGMNIQSFEGEYKPEIDEQFIGLLGMSTGFVVGGCMASFTIEGQIPVTPVANSILLATFATAFVPENTTAFFGQTGGLYLKGATVKQVVNGWMDLSAKLESRSNVA